ALLVTSLSLSPLPADVLVEPAQELRVLVRGQRALATGRAAPARAAAGTAALGAVLADDQPGDRTHPGQQHDQQDPGPLRDAAHLLALGLDAVREREDRQTDGGNGKDPAHGVILGNAPDRGGQR